MTVSLKVTIVYSWFVDINIFILQDHVSSSKDHVSTGDHVSSKEQVAMGGTFAGVGEFSPVTMTTTALPYDHHSNLVKDDTACIRLPVM